MNFKLYLIRIILIIFFVVSVLAIAPQMQVFAASSTDAEFEAQLTSEGFPESYKTKLRALHRLHPNWTFKAKQLNYTWAEALDKQCSNVNANLVSNNFPAGYKAVQNGTYNFDTHTYIGKDGASWVAASRQAVAFYMDPRNWLDESSIFMFEPNLYDASYQTEDLVKKILSTTALPSTAAKYYIEAAEQTYNGKKYSISPVYLASKTRLELGSSDFMINGHAFTYGGKKYSGLYNAYNIGATDSADGTAALKGLVYAAGGSDGKGTTYLRPWNTLKKAVTGGALYIAGTFFERNQYTSYYERYNVLNGLSGIGTYQYATSIFAAATQSAIIHGNYYDYKVLTEAFSFEIPVFKSMPSSPAAKPGSGSNNCYLDDISVSLDGKKLSFISDFNRFTADYTVKQTIGAVDKLTISTKKNDSAATVSVSGNTTLNEGINKITVKVTAPSGAVSKTYNITVVKDSSAVPDPNEKLIEGVENTTIKASSVLGEGNIQVSWTKSAGYKMDYYEVYRSTTSGSYSTTPYFVTTNGTKTTYKNTKNLKDGTRYYYRVRGVRVIDGKTYYSKWSNQAYRTYRAPELSNEKIIEGVQATTLNAAAVSVPGTIQLSWTKSGAYAMDYYQVFRRGENEEYGSAPHGVTASGDIFAYEDKSNMTENATYYYKVRGVRNVDGIGYYTPWSSEVSRVYKPDYSSKIAGVQATTIKASSVLGAGYIQINWKKSAGYKVDYFEIYRSTKSGEYSSTPFFKTTDGVKNSYKNTKSLKKGTRYYYKIRGVRTFDGTKYYTKWSNQAYRTYK